MSVPEQKAAVGSFKKRCVLHKPSADCKVEALKVTAFGLLLLMAEASMSATVACWARARRVASLAAYTS